MIRQYPPSRILLAAVLAAGPLLQAGGLSTAKSNPVFPLAFEAGANNEFVARGPGFAMSLSPSRAALAVLNGKEKDKGTILYWRLKGADSSARGILQDPLGAKANYFLGSDPKQWRTNIAMHGKARYLNVYPGVDIVYYGNNRQLEYDFVLAPGADPQAIAWSFEGGTSARIDEQGDLLVDAEGGSARFHKPVAWQEVDGKRRLVAASFGDAGNGKYRFRLGAYDRSRELIIDPFISFAAVYGGSSTDYPRALALDSSGNFIIAGYTYSSNLPLLNPFQATRSSSPDVFVAKLSADGTTLLSSTYLGGSSSDHPYAVQSDAAGNLYVAGYTNSLDFPTLAATQSQKAASSDGFLAKLTPSGSALVYSTFLGGNSSDNIQAMSVDAVSGTAGVTGYTYSTDFPVTVGSAPSDGTQKAFAAVYSPVGIRTYSTVLAGQYSYGYGAYLDASGALWVAGYTQNAAFPTTAGAYQTTLGGCYDAFLSKLKPDGSGLLYSTFFGGADCDYAYALTADGSGNLLLGGTAYGSLPQAPSGTPFQATPGGGGDGFVAKFTSAGAFSWSTYLGGSGYDSLSALTTDPAGNIFAAGTTQSLNFPLVNPLQSAKIGGISSLYTSDNRGGAWASHSFFNGASINVLATSKSNANLVYAVGSCNLYKSGDRGATWVNVGNQSFFCSVQALHVNPVNQQILYGYDLNGNYFQRSDDGGVTWTSIRAGLPAAGLNFGYSARGFLAISPSAPSTVYFANGSSGVYRTTDAGATWSAIANLPAGTWYRVFINPAGGAVSPETITVVGSNGIYRSADGAGTWTAITRPAIYDAGNLVVDPTNPLTIYAPSGPKMSKTTNGGTSWTTLSLPSSSSLTFLAVDPANPAELYWSGYNNGIYGSFDGGATWSSLNGSTPFRMDTLRDLAILPGAGASRLLVVSDTNADLFITKLNPQGTSATWSTYLGVPGYDVLGGIKANASGLFLLSLLTGPDSVAATPGAYSSPNLGGYEASLLKLTDSGSCNYVLPATQTLDSYGGDGRFRVTTGSGCSWSVSASPAWVAVAPTTSGTGMGMVEFTYARNAAGASRTGNVVVNGQSVALTQPAASCGLSFSTTSILRSPDAYTWNNAFYVYSSSYCSWTAESDSGTWLTVTGGSSGMGGAYVSLGFTANASSSGRSGFITVRADSGEQVKLPVVQSGFGCSTSLSSAAGSIGAAAGIATVPFVSTPAACAGWTASSDSGWARPTVAAGAGSSNVEYTIDANPWDTPRKANLTVGGSSFVLTQAAGSGCTASGSLTPLTPVQGSIVSSPCYSALRSTPTSKYWVKRYTFSALSGSEVAITMKGQSGFYPYFYLVGPDGANLGGSSAYDSLIQRYPYSGFYRLPSTGTYIVEATSNSASTAGDFQLQLENRCDVIPSAFAYGFGPAGGTASVNLLSPAGCTWTALAMSSALTVSPSSGSGSGTVNFTLPALLNTNRVSTFAMQLGGQWFYVTQSNPSGYITFTPTSINLSGAAQSGLTSGISSNSYSLRSTQPWLRYSGFTNSTTFSYTVDANTTGAARSAQLVLGDSSYTVNQSAPAGLTISGKVTQSGSPLASVTLTLSGGLSATTITNATGDYQFTGLTAGASYTITASRQGLTFLPASATFSGLAANQTANFSSAAVPGAITFNRSSLTFAAAVGSPTVTTPDQSVALTFAGPPASWTASANQAWLRVTPASGSANTQLTVSLVPGALPSVGQVTGSITVTASGSPNSPQTLPVSLTVRAAASSAAPFGLFEAPANGANLMSSFALGGWALDDTGVANVKIYRDPVGAEPTQPNGYVYIGDAVFVPGSRPDVEGAYPAMPQAYRAGWGYMLLSYFLPNGGNGSYRLYAIATDMEGKQATLGSKSITVDNAHAVKPFGAIDTPGQGETVGGAAYVNFGWALTPQPAKIPVDGSTIRVWVDGTPLGTVTYNNPRADIDTLFPTYANRYGAVGYRYLDTTALANGIHNIAWSVVDNQGHEDGIGSRFFWVFNGSSAPASVQLPKPAAAPESPQFRTGYDLRRGFEPLRDLEVGEAERVEINLPAGQWTGYLKVGDELRELPAGSSLDGNSGVFMWQLGPGFLGEYELVFRSDGQSAGVRVRVAPQSLERSKM